MTQTIKQLKTLLRKLDQYGHAIDTPSTNPTLPTLGTKLALLCLSCAVIVYLALFNPLGVTPDYAGYIASFDRARQQSWSQMLSSPRAWEPGFMALVFLLAKAIEANSWVFLLIVAFASSFKVGLLYRISSPIAFLLAMVLFFFKYFPLQDYNQLRGAIAISFLMLVYYQWIWKGNLWLAILFSVFSVSFHYLALALLPFILLAKHPITSKKIFVVVGGLLFCLALWTLSTVIVAYAAIGIPGLNDYMTRFKPATSSYLSPVLYPELILCTISLIFWNDCTENMKRVVGIQMMGFAIFYGFFEFDVIAIRLREAFSILWLFYLADYSRTTPRLRLATVTFVLMNIAVGSYLFYFSNYLK